MIKIKALLVAVIYCLSLAFAQTALAQETTASLPQEEIVEAVINRVVEERQIKPAGSSEYHLTQKLELLVTNGSIEGQTIEVENGGLSSVYTPKYKKNERVLVAYTKDPQGNNVYYITDYVRRRGLGYLLAIFVVLAITIAGRQGIFSLVGMGISFLVIFEYILPKIATGWNPVLVVISGSLLIIPATFYLSHGFNKKTTVAIAGTLVALTMTVVLASVFVNVTNLSGFASEEAGFLQVAKPGLINMQGLLLAGIIIGALGVLDDITVSQAAIVFQLKETDPAQKFSQLYRRAMNVGRDHISSMVNTLVLVYTGASLPLLLLFINNPHPFTEVINYEIVADEVVRTLVGSSGLILAVPVTTLIAGLVFGRNEKKQKA